MRNSELIHARYRFNNLNCKSAIWIYKNTILYNSHLPITAFYNLRYLYYEKKTPAETKYKTGVGIKTILKLVEKFGDT